MKRKQVEEFDKRKKELEKVERAKQKARIKEQNRLKNLLSKSIFLGL